MAAFVIAFFKLLDPFGIDAALTRNAAEIVSRARGVCYPEGLASCLWPGEPQTLAGRESIAVVLYDTAAIRTPGIGWPPPFAVQAKTLRDIAAQQPRAIFVDIVFGVEREGPAATTMLADAIREARLDGIPVLLGDFISGDEPPRHCADGRTMPGGTVLLEIACAATATLPVSWILADNDIAYPLLIPVEGGERPSPALALYRLVHPEAESAPPALTPALQPSPQHGTEATEAAEVEDAMFLVWGVGLSPLMRAKPGAEHCAGAGGRPSFFERLWLIGGAVMPGVAEHFPRHAGADLKRCAHNDQWSVLELANIDEGAPNLEGRFVFLGAGFTGNLDLVRTPLHGQLPGVHQHAMALDNLLTFGLEAQPRIDRRQLFGLQFENVAAAGAALGVLVLQVVWTAMSPSLRPPAAWLRDRVAGFGRVVEARVSRNARAVFPGAMRWLNDAARVAGRLLRKAGSLPMLSHAWRLVAAVPRVMGGLVLSVAGLLLAAEIFGFPNAQAVIVVVLLLVVERLLAIASKAEELAVEHAHHHPGVHGHPPVGHPQDGPPGAEPTS